MGFEAYYPGFLYKYITSQRLHKVSNVRGRVNKTFKLKTFKF